MDEAGRRYVLKQAEERKVRFIRLWFADILGHLKSFAIPASQLEDALRDGVTFDGSAIRGMARRGENDMVAMPDPSTFQILPWRPTQESTVARMFCDITDPNGHPCETDPRYALKRVVREAAEAGYAFYVGPEIEYFYFRSPKGAPEALDEGGYFDLTPHDAGSDLRRETILLLEQLGIEVNSSHHEVAPSQHEIALQHSDALSMADQTLTARLVIKEVARQHGVYATFMPKPVYGQCGSGMHLHLSLFAGDRNLFHDSDRPDELSPIARQFMAGTLRYAPEMTLVLNQWTNSYKRLVPGFEAPVHASWGGMSSADFIRVPTLRANRPEATRLEARSPDSACNPYLAYAVLLAAGMEGVRAGEEPPPPSEQCPSLEENAGWPRLPRDLGEAIERAQESDFLRTVLGKPLLDALLSNKVREWEEYRRQITPYELDQYLPTL